MTEKTEDWKEALDLIHAEMKKRGYEDALAKKPARQMALPYVREYESGLLEQGRHTPWPDPLHFCDCEYCPCKFD